MDARVHNAEAVSLDAVPVLSVREFRDAALACSSGGGRIVALFGERADRADPRGSGAEPVRITMVMAPGDQSGVLAVTAADVEREYPALTPDCPEAHWFEREIAEQCGVVPRGHPWLKPVRDATGISSEFFRVRGEEVHEVAVGPVHAGIIEPGHFRFQCHGETVLHLEIALGYQHRGVERALRDGPDKRTIHYIETLAGDTSVGHATAYSQAVEALAGVRVPARAAALRGIAAELERLANHVGDLGALAGDVGYLPTLSYCGRIRGDFLNMTALISGSRFGRGFVRPGGVGFDVDEAMVAELLERLDRAVRDAAGAVRLAMDAPSVMARFEGTGTLARADAEALGLVGPAARASRVARDVRHEFPQGIYRFAQLPLSTWASGDVAGRAHVRWLEVERSAAFVREQLENLPAGPVSAGAGGALAPRSLVVSLTEGWRGEICHVAMTGADGRFTAYKIVDPSFHNWMGLALAMRGQPVSDFPLCNKSFNLSYCGHDL